MTDEQSQRPAGKFGKLAAKHDRRSLKLADYLAPDLPPPPDRFNILPRCEQATSVTDPRKLFPMDGNDSNGCCVPAALAHAITAWTAQVGKKRIPAASRVVKTYYQLTGGEDTGLYEMDTLNKFRQQGLFGEKILAYCTVNFRNPLLAKQAISIFGSVLIGFTVQVGCLDDFHNHRIWQANEPTNEGHAVLLVGYTPDYVVCLTWGGVQRGTWDWLAKMGDEMYAILPGEATLQGFSPDLDYAALKADLARVTS